jgi:antitoxin (DNA-binding transcriptional repressor) of toxin-antitoxin stability system
MKTVPLRQLVREPLKIKRLTKAGHKVQVTDNGKPLWIISAAAEDVDEETRIRETDAILDETLSEKPSRISAVELLEQSRR